MNKPSKQQTNTQMTLAGGAIAVVLMWLLGFYQPELMEAAPAGLETAIGTIIIFLFGVAMPGNATVVGPKLPAPPPMPNKSAPEIH